MNYTPQNWESGISHKTAAAELKSRIFQKQIVFYSTFKNKLNNENFNEF